MSNDGKPMFMHIVSVYDVVKDEDGSTRICILDNHQYEDRREIIKFTKSKIEMCKQLTQCIDR